MYRIYESKDGQRTLIGRAWTRAAAEALVMNAAGNPLLRGSAMGAFRGPHEFLARDPGGPNYEIVEDDGAHGPSEAA